MWWTWGRGRARLAAFPKPVIARVTEFKQLADLHTDQLSQAFLLRFAESGELAAHQKRLVAAGRLARTCIGTSFPPAGAKKPPLARAPRRFPSPALKASAPKSPPSVFPAWAGRTCNS